MGLDCREMHLNVDKFQNFYGIVVESGVQFHIPKLAVLGHSIRRLHWKDWLSRDSQFGAKDTHIRSCLLIQHKKIFQKVELHF